jgi:hypothetical protein
MATKTKGKNKPSKKGLAKKTGPGTRSLKDAGATGSEKEMRKAVKRGSGGGQYMSRIPAEGRTVRFLHEPHEWFKFFEHYDESREDNRYQPCTEDCDGCERGLTRSKRWVANAWDVEEGRVIPQVLPATLAQNLMKKYDKFHTIMDRDYELMKDGQQKETTYDALYDGPSKFNAKKHGVEMIDLEALVLSQLDDPDADDDDDDDDDDTPVKSSKSKGKAKKSKRKEDPTDADDEDEPPHKGKTKGKTPPKKTAKKPPAKGLKKKPLSKKKK